MSSAKPQHRKFIATFVNELYAILIAIGLADIIFRQGIDPADGFQIIMAVFVTAVVSLYWWDWAAYVEDHFVASPAEFVIDFAGVIVLEFLFRYFDQPLSLAANFLVLGMVDLVWVVNHIREHPDETFRLRRWWVGQKVLGVVVYGAGWALVLAVQASLGTRGIGLSGLVVIVTACVVRFLCFRELRGKRPVTIRPPRQEEVQSLLSINRCYTTTSRTEGFLLEELSESTLRVLLEERPPRLFVAGWKDEIWAYAKVSYDLPEEILAAVQWLDPELEALVRRGPVLHIEQVAVRPDRVGLGFGRRVYEWLIHRHQNLVPCAFVSLRPRCNLGSMRFHAALQFEKTALFSRGDFLGEKDYQSLLLVRRPAGSGG